jgi:hypothetical protein
MRTRLTRRGQGLVAGLIVAAIGVTSWAVQHPAEKPAMDNDPAPITWTCPDGWEFQASTFTCEVSWTN